jgi:hypothetical protein
MGPERSRARNEMHVPPHLPNADAAHPGTRPGARPRRPLLALLLAFVAMLPVAATPARAEQVDLQLVLAADVSRSVDAEEFALQREGYATAFQDPRVLRAIRSGPLGRIAVCFVEWSGEWEQHVTVDWTVIRDEESAKDFAAALVARPRPFAGRTAIGAAIDHAVARFAQSGHQSQRRTIDVSGDGTNTNGKLPSVARDAAVAQGIVINGLVILSPVPMPWNPYHTHPPGGLGNYFQENVAGGPGSFVMVVEDFQSFAYAIANKLIREIAKAPDVD